MPSDLPEALLVAAKDDLANDARHSAARVELENMSIDLAREVLDLGGAGEALAEALDALLLAIDVTLDDLVIPLLEKAVTEKHGDSKSALERERQQGIADALRQVRIYLEDNEGVQPRATGQAALHRWAELTKEEHDG
ncbi:hypothetical protein LCGC14_2570490 [marine sediment metagenome]|uniref:Uncharacterized protein n=1 Tax=marine sediment metagenome TaxID=412755 RepID=A0A0F9CTH9_9ZZZZ